MDRCSILSAILDISDTTGAIASELEHVKSDSCVHSVFNQPKVFQNPNRIW